MELLSLFLLLSMTILSSSTLFETGSGVKSAVDDRVVMHGIMQPAAKDVRTEESSGQGETKAVSQIESDKEDAVKQDDSIKNESETPRVDDEDTEDTEEDEEDEDEEEEGIDGAKDLSHIPGLKEIIRAEKGELDQSIDKTMQLEATKTQSQKRPPSVKTQFHPKEKTVKLRLTQTEKQSGTLDEYEGDLEALNDFKKAFHIPVKELPTKPAEKPETSDLNNQLNPHVPTVLGNQPTLTGTAWFFCREYMQYLTAIVSNATRSRHKEHEVYGRLVVTDKRYEKEFSWASAMSLSIRTPEIITTDFPTLSYVIDTFHTLEAECKATLNSLEMHPGRQKISRESLERREEIADAMRTFEDRYRGQGVTRVDAENYCKTMAKYVTDEAI